MAKRSKKRKQNNRKRNRHASPPREAGFDYGITPNVAALGSIDFNQKLRDAGIVGVSYGIDYSTDLNSSVPCLSLVGQREAPLKEAFSEFSNWASFSDADAVDVSVLLRKAGGYDLAISPEPRALIDRALRFDAVVTPLSIQIAWIKRLDTVSEPLLQLRAHLAKGIKPFLLSAGIYTGPMSGPGMSPQHIKPISGLPQLLKFRIKFADEGKDTATPWGSASKGPKSMKDIRRHDPREALPPKSRLNKLRADRLKALFPVTLWRFRSQRTHTDDLRHMGLRDWQIHQAICNLIVSRELFSSFHFPLVDAKDWPMTIVNHLQKRFEIADGESTLLRELPTDAIVYQVLLDSRVLLATYERDNRQRDLPETLAALANASLLDQVDD